MELNTYEAYKSNISLVLISVQNIDISPVLTSVLVKVVSIGHFPAFHIVLVPLGNVLCPFIKISLWISSTTTT